MKVIKLFSLSLPDSSLCLSASVLAEELSDGNMTLTFGIFPKDGLSMSLSGVTMALCTLTLLLVALRGRKREGAGHHKGTLPPGPTPWPLVGNLFQMGDQIHLSLTRLRLQYGDVFQMRMGSLVVVVLSGYATIRQALVRQGEAFAGRPDLFTFSAVANGTSMTFSEKYGPAWVLHKKLCKNALRSFSQAEPRGPDTTCLLEEHVCAEAAGMVEAIWERSEASDGLGLDPVVPLVTSVANVVCALCFGKRYDYNDKEFLTIVHINNEVLRIFAAGNMADFFPVFRYLPSPSLRKMVQHIRRMNSFMEHNIEDKLEHATENVLESGLQWSLLYLIKFPDIQVKIHQEIDEHIGPARLPRFEDKPKMPFTEAFLYEVFRHTSYVPFTIPHCTTQNITLNGYFIPKDTCVFINQYQVNHDIDLWGDPDVFRPERFLGKEGLLNKDLTEKVMIFGMGKRRCLGDGFARLEMFVFLTTLLHRLCIENVPGQELDLSTDFGLTMKPQPFPHWSSNGLIFP
uniref:Cytochrome P450, family 1, subfamily D, polypeptide 1 n=1 Tax=Hucho hucho TaxID=62062 RepID=A0A4W5QUZ6_9TELE